METDYHVDGNEYKHEIDVYSSHPKLTITCTIVFIIVLFGGAVFFSAKYTVHGGGNLTPTGSPLKFGSSNASTVSQGAVEGASTEQYGPAEPSQAMSSSQMPTATVVKPTFTPTSIPTSTQTPTPVPTATPTPTNTPTPTHTPTPTVSPTLTPTATPTPTIMITPTPSLSPVPNE